MTKVVGLDQLSVINQKVMGKYYLKLYLKMVVKYNSSDDVA